MAHTFSDLLVHVVFGTKDRRPTIDDSFRAPLFAYMCGILQQHGAKEITINGTRDHAHILMAAPATVALSDLVRQLKSSSTLWVHEQYRESLAFSWQTGYGAFAVSRSNYLRVRSYIEQQEEHHRHKSFEEEFLAFLKKHNVRYDPAFLWR
ncbi:MAG TPA: IS200/IS605 family transposase [Methylomirabilota bacterium]|nr:IS200/IS605 family transposase [Methylomirabilota bacterium]